MNRFDAPARALQYESRDSLLHRTGAVAKGVAAMGIAACALWLDSLPALLVLLGAVLSGYGWAGLTAGDACRDLRWLGLQALILVGITIGLRGVGALEDASRTALQLLLVFLPIALVVRTTGMMSLLDELRGRLPERAAFAVGATMRFAPFFARELAELVEMQRLRGARLATRELRQPRAWKDWLACVALPMTVRAIEIAEEAADAAAMRGIGTTGPEHEKDAQ